MEKEINSVLGHTVTYPQNYQPDILVPIPRQTNRSRVGISTPLPFGGVDVWHAYEASCLTNSGLPTAGLLKIVVPACSPFIVESKSLKLYLNSFNMERLGRTAAEANTQMAQTVRRDLSRLLCADVAVSFFNCDAPTAPTPETDSRFSVIEDAPGAASTPISCYSESPSLLTPINAANKAQFLKSHLLRSNCPVTRQPDWGTIYVAIEGERHVDPVSLLRYIVSLRAENHFHEEICELVFKRLQDALAPSSLSIMCRYTRRGGIDITPIRHSAPASPYDSIAASDNLTMRVDRM